MNAGMTFTTIAVVCVTLFHLVDMLPARLMLKSESNEVPGVGRQKNKYAGIRPSPSDDLPIVPLQFPKGAIPPSDNDLDPMKLRRLLGNQYDPTYMSHVSPIELLVNPNGTYVYNFKKGRPLGQLLPEIRRLSFELSGEDAQKIKIKSRKKRRRFQRYLATYTYCPIYYKWRDLGIMFWPQWIREGDCRSERSCSIPAGMSCKAELSTTMTVLYWHCRVNRKRSQCRWIEIKYPIITKCGCRC